MTVLGDGAAMVADAARVDGWAAAAVGPDAIQGAGNDADSRPPVGRQLRWRMITVIMDGTPATAQRQHGRFYTPSSGVILEIRSV